MPRNRRSVSSVSAGCRAAACSRHAKRQGKKGRDLVKGAAVRIRTMTPDGLCRRITSFLSELLVLEGSGWADISQGSRRRNALLPRAATVLVIHRIPQEGE